MIDPLTAPLRQWLLERHQRQPALICGFEDAADLRRVLAAAGLEVRPTDLTDEMLRAACDAERAHDHASPCHACGDRCGNGNIAAALRAALRVKDAPTGLEYRGG